MKCQKSLIDMESGLIETKGDTAFWRRVSAGFIFVIISFWIPAYFFSEFNKTLQFLENPFLTTVGFTVVAYFLGSMVDLVWESGWGRLIFLINFENVLGKPTTLKTENEFTEMNLLVFPVFVQRSLSPQAVEIFDRLPERI